MIKIQCSSRLEDRNGELVGKIWIGLVGKILGPFRVGLYDEFMVGNGTSKWMEFHGIH